VKRLVVVFVVLVVLAAAAAAVGILLAGRGEHGPALGGGKLLVWEIDRPVVDWAPAGPLPFAAYDTTDSMERLYRTFRAARQDDSVKGLAVTVRQTQFGLAKAQELRRQLKTLSVEGKFIACYLETAGDGGNGTLPYYLATACDDVWLSPAGELAPLGLYLDSVFLAGAMEKLKIDPELDHVGRFKGAGETFTRRGHSDDTRQAVEALLDSYFAQIVAAIAHTRELDEATVRELIDGAPYSAEEALELGLVDAVGYPDEFRDTVREIVGDPREVDLRDYRHGERRRRHSGNTVAVLFAVGTIVRGGGGSSPLTEEIFLGSDDMRELLAELREDASIDAVVLRVDSPGGSALASDLILREVELLAAEKPVVVSMSDVAASGGYYIAAKAHHIVAEPGTVTGSIGVVGGKLVTTRFQEEVLGVTHETIQRGANADLYSTLSPYSDEQRQRVRRAMQRTYDLFVGHVAAGRDMEPGAVEAVAQGRVWSGEDARARGLVDDLGGLDRAIELAREEARIEPDEEVRLVFYPREPTLLHILAEARSAPLPASVRRLLARLETRPRGALELPPELAGLASPF
jgi:protease IV